jgi:hypothetical protein
MYTSGSTGTPKGYFIYLILIQFSRSLFLKEFSLDKYEKFLGIFTKAEVPGVSLH